MSARHTTPHPLAGKTVTVTAELNGAEGPHEFRVEDWNDRVFGESWTHLSFHPAATVYAVRAGLEKLPLDNEVVYGKVGSFGHLVHVSEIQGGGA